MNSFSSLSCLALPSEVLWQTPHRWSLLLPFFIYSCKAFDNLGRLSFWTIISTDDFNIITYQCDYYALFLFSFSFLLFALLHASLLDIQEIIITRMTYTIVLKKHAKSVCWLVSHILHASYMLQIAPQRSLWEVGTKAEWCAIIWQPHLTVAC